ncbi:serine/threonine-protein kinase [Nonomuraea sp. NPDC049400]|uniref:serine/threonine-protein kinase n=1 Tax=Nonomuraea sp. NPDC049400 TaxID=3364352 RepID=UPI0037AA3B39
MEPLRQEGSRQMADGRVVAGRYRLTDLLGRGGMGAVWRAHDEQLKREVAAKELDLPEQLDDAQRQAWIARLDREARAAARLKHPGIVTVHDRVTGDDGRPWIIMELVRGRSLQDLLTAEGSLPPRQVAQIGLQVLDALSTAHQAGITHRDVKPANILLEGDRVILTDFGIAAVEGDVTLTATGAVLGTPVYMSPEQVLGQKVTAVSDLWSLGATLYTAVEGHPPFQGASTGAIFVAIATGDPAPSAHAGPLEPVLKALLHRDPSQRPTARHLHAQLAPLAQDRTPAGSSTLLLTSAPPPAQPLIAQPPAPPGQQLGPSRRPARSRKKIVRLVLTAAAAALALILTATVAVPAIEEMQERARYEENMNTIAGMGRLPGESTDMYNAGSGKVNVTSVLCEKTFTSPADRCDLDGQVTAAVNWFQAQPGVRSVIFNDAREKCGLTGFDGGCELSILTQSPLRITNVKIRNEGGGTESVKRDQLTLMFTVG